MQLLIYFSIIISLLDKMIKMLLASHLFEDAF